MKRTYRTVAMLAPAALALLVFAMPSQASAKGGGNDLVSFGNDVTVREGQEVKGDLVVFGGDAKVYGHVDGDAAVMGGDLYIAPTGQVDGSTVAFGGSVTNDSSQAGSGKHHAPNNSGYTQPAPVVPPVPYDNSGDQSDHGPPTAWYTLLTILGILCLLAFAIAPGSVRTLREELVRRPVPATVVGFSWPFILAVVMIALAITVIGIVLMPAVIVAVMVAYLIGRATVAQLLGRRLFEVANVVEPSPLATAALGLIIITVVEALLPLWMGIVLEACVSCVALGAAMIAVIPALSGRQTASAVSGGYAPPPTPVFTPPSPPPPSGPPAVPQ